MPHNENQIIMTKKSVKKLVDEKLSTLIEKYYFEICDFLTIDGCYEMSKAQYEMLKNHKAKIKILDNDPNYDYVVIVDNFEAYCIFDD